jgi:NAD(P)-dependent dehydrogenase (short-subunit alcohol dehydrogenase family)
MKDLFTNKTALITGASSGIGEACAHRFAKLGAQVILHYNSGKAKAKKIVSSLPGNGHIIIGADLGNPDDIQKLVHEAVDKVGKIDMLVNNAGIYEETDWLSLSYEEWLEYWNKTISVNLNGASHLSFLVAKHMTGKGGGKIVNVTSRGAFRGEPDALPYGASKAGLNAVGQSMAKALAAKNVFVFTIAPGYVNTAMTEHIINSPRGSEINAQSPMNRIASSDEIAHAITMLASDGMEYATGCILDMNGASYLRT